MKHNSILNSRPRAAGASASYNYVPGVPAVSADPAAEPRTPIIEM